MSELFTDATVTAVSVDSRVEFNSETDWNTLFDKFKENHSGQCILKVEVRDEFKSFSNCVPTSELSYYNLRDFLEKFRVGDVFLYQGLLRVMFYLLN